MARLDFFGVGVGGCAGRGKISGSAGAAVASNAEPSVPLSGDVTVLVEVSTVGFCEFFSALLEVFLGADSEFATASAGFA
jgi:hypothetical protein